ncbi:TetR/AcrR family transcriptional regulator [Pseudoruegeria sp. SHC-113]|uniref:TetR/AcrR family transcriptional regulator n=1 Tax=Pseudoruegeria sp. SHC-113 TaxID=2855439 RepID=UPI0021BB7695|nr:TetR family transcriptional regulator [Pseudoruegeria sp. SHC-113]MCT8162037.1 TetR family transcriptional regulator [Pseudoruegeria sp. SHC-113]
MARKTGTSAAETGARIHAAALRLFAEQGYDAVSMRQIAGEAGVQAGAIYLHTKDKQTLLFSLMTAFLQARQDALAPLSTEDSPNARIKGFVQGHLALTRANPDAARLVQNEARALEGDYAAIVGAFEAGYRRHLMELLAQGREADAFQVPDEALIADAILALLNHVPDWQTAHPEFPQEKLDRIHENMIRRILKS